MIHQQESVVHYDIHIKTLLNSASGNRDSPGAHQAGIQRAHIKVGA